VTRLSILRTNDFSPAIVLPVACQSDPLDVQWLAGDVRRVARTVATAAEIQFLVHPERMATRVQYVGVMLLLRSMLLAGALTILPGFSQTPALDPDEVDDQAQPGIIQFAGLTEQDTVSLDGEVVPAGGLRRTGYNLLIAPGIYTVKVHYAETGRTCTSRVVVEAEQTVEPACPRRSSSQLAD
jgi:hypothetical protein